MTLKKVLAAVVANMVLAVVAAYWDIWVLTIGGFLDIVHGVKANPTDNSEIGWGILKMLSSGALAFVVVFAGLAITCMIFGKSIMQGIRYMRARLGW